MKTGKNFHPKGIRHNNYKPKSWQYQAREMCDYQIAQYYDGWTTPKGIYDFFSWSYRNKLIKRRAAKRFYRTFYKKLQ